MSKEATCSLTGLEWAQLLCSQPQFADRCDWATLDGNAWHCLLCSQPQFADRCDWAFTREWDGAGTFDMCAPSRWYWITLLIMQPQFANKCDIWEELKDSVSSWRRVAHACTGLFNRQSGKDNRSIPNKSNNDSPEKPDGIIQALILKMDPSGASLPGFDHFKGDDWTVFLSSIQSIPDFVLRQCPWAKLNGENWASILAKKPELADKCNWAKLDGGNWAMLLGKQPQFADKCDWAMLDGGNWAELLGKQPQFADKCDWEKLGGNKDYWYTLLCSKPEFKDKFESLTGRKFDKDDYDEWLTDQLW